MILGRPRSSWEALLVVLGALRERPGDLPINSGWPRAPEMSRDRPGSHFGSILDAPGGSQARFLANFVIDFGCLRRRFRMPFAVHCGRYKAECLR